MKNITLFILAVSLFGVMVAVSFLKAERSNRRITRPVEESLRSAPRQAATRDAQSAVPDETKSLSSSSAENGSPALAVGKVDPTKSSTNPTTIAGEQANLDTNGVAPGSPDKQIAEPETIASSASGENISVDASDEKSELAPLTLTAVKLDVESQTESKTTNSEAKVISESKSKEDEILDYFQESLDQLPDDLTSYEKKVAIKEVRDEVLEIFKITLTRLNKLTKKHKINYP